MKEIEPLEAYEVTEEQMASALASVAHESRNADTKLYLHPAEVDKFLEAGIRREAIEVTGSISRSFLFERIMREREEQEPKPTGRDIYTYNLTGGKLRGPKGGQAQRVEKRRKAKKAARKAKQHAR